MRARLHFIVLTLLLCLPALAANEGRVFGTVTDASGSPVADAKVTLIREGTQWKQEKVTSEKGTFNLFVLDATATYRIRIEKEQFEPIEEAIKLVPNDTMRVSYTLRPSIANPK